MVAECARSMGGVATFFMTLVSHCHWRTGRLLQYYHCTSYLLPTTTYLQCQVLPCTTYYPPKVPCYYYQVLRPTNMPSFGDAAVFLHADSLLPVTYSSPNDPTSHKVDDARHSKRIDLPILDADANEGACLQHAHAFFEETSSFQWNDEENQHTLFTRTLRGARKQDWLAIMDNVQPGAPWDFEFHARAWLLRFCTPELCQDFIRSMDSYPLSHCACT